MIRHYYSIIKPGIIYGNVTTVIAGFLFASSGGVDFWLLVSTILGISLVIASGCVFNNYIDSDIDVLMERTKSRAIVLGHISPRNALIYATVLSMLGFFFLVRYTNIATVIAAIIGLLVYVVAYSIWLKRSSTSSILVGSISGAMPILVGYLSVRGYIDVEAVILFVILAVWQVPHSLAISIYRLKDYRAAKIPVLPIINGIERTKVEIFVYSVLFMFAVLLLPAFGYVGVIYMVVMTLCCAAWIILCIRGLWANLPDEQKWAKSVFLFSILILLVFCAMSLLY